MKTLALGLALCALSLAPALADDCGPLKIAASAPLQSLNDGRMWLIPVKINGTEKHFILDTGGYISQITSQAAQDLKLPVGGSLLWLRDAGANKSNASASVETLQVGNAQLKNTNLNIMPGDDFWAAHGIDGLLSMDLFLSYDLDLDFGHAKVNFVSPDHCPGKVIYWPAEAYAQTPLRIVNGHYLIDVELDKQRLTAVLDTGATRTILGSSVAHQYFGLSPEAGLDATNMKLNGALATYTHKFGDLSFNGVDMQTPTIAIVDFPNDISNRRQPQLGTRIPTRGDVDRHYDMILGMDMLRHLHVYIATNERTVYITPK